MRFVLLAVLLLPFGALAQSFDELGIPGDSFSVSVTPEFPSPYGEATLSFLSSALELTQGTLSVVANGKNIYQGTVQPVKVPLGKPGSVTSVTATVTIQGTPYQQTVRIAPQDVVLVAEPLSSVPPLYLGKGNVPVEGSVRMVAIANLRNASGAVLSPSTLSYVWTVDDTQIQNSSGIGKNVLVVQAPLQYRSRDVSVTVTSADGALVGGGTFSLSPVEPLVRIYEHDPLLGIRFERALTSSFSIDDRETVFYGAPFSLPTGGLLEWFIDGSSVQNGNSITLRPTGSGEGSASLSLVARAGTYTTATAYLSILFGNKPSGFFGL